MIMNLSYLFILCFIGITEFKLKNDKICKRVVNVIFQKSEYSYLERTITILVYNK